MKGSWMDSPHLRRVIADNEREDRSKACDGAGAADSVHSPGSDVMSDADASAGERDHDGDDHQSPSSPQGRAVRNAQARSRQRAREMVAKQRRSLLVAGGKGDRVGEMLMRRKRGSGGGGSTM